MKKIIILLVILLLSACRVKAPEKVIIEQQNTTFWGEISEVEYKGHTYIVFTEGNGYGEGLGVIHDPDCPCFIKYN